MRSTQDFYEDVYAVVRLIPSGRVTSYGAIAQFLGARTGARMVGYAMHACMGRPDVPAHRVVNSKGLLTGKVHFGGGGRRMAQLLRAEGVLVRKDQVQHFKTVYWDPNAALTRSF